MGLSILEETRGEEIREHLALCPACSERLQDEEEVRTRAQALLRVPDVEVGSMPAFEDLRARAEVQALGEAEVEALGEAEVGSRTTRRGLLKGLPLAWAATIVLALGVGWMGGKLQQSMPNDFSVSYRKQIRRSCLLRTFEPLLGCRNRRATRLRQSIR